MGYKTAQYNGWKVAIHKSKSEDKVISFASEGWGMSDSWWMETYKKDDKGDLLGVYQTDKGLRRLTI